MTEKDLDGFFQQNQDPPFPEILVEDTDFLVNFSEIPFEPDIAQFPEMTGDIFNSNTSKKYLSNQMSNVKIEPNSPSPTSPSNLTLVPQMNQTCQVIVQPEIYQVAKYNIYPAPEIGFHKYFDEPQTVQAVLCHSGSTEISQGFTTGDVQVLKPGQNKVTFPALHLNLMTPIKNSVQQSGFTTSEASFSIKFKIGDLEIFSNPFKLVSAASQIPKGMDVRPRKDKPNINPIQEKKRRKETSPSFDSTEESSFFHVKIRGENTHRGFISLRKGDSLKDARSEILRSDNYPPDFLFWHHKFQAFVQKYQEEETKAEDSADDTCLVIEPHDSSLKDVDKQILSLWTTQSNSTIPLVPMNDVIRMLFSVYKASTDDPNDFTIIQGGIHHFFANLTKSKGYMISLDDLKLFLKFYGPAQECLNKVLSVYRENFFHGFARHSDAVALLRRKPGGFLFRYSESQLKDGFFAFNVNKGNKSEDVVENYSIQYNPELKRFVFRNKIYETLSDFVKDPEYSHILKQPIPKETSETIKESKYKLETDFLSISMSKMEI